MKKYPPYKWTVFFLIRSVKDFWEITDTMIKEILSAAINDEVAVIICLNAYEESLSKEYPRGRPNKGEGFTTVFYQVDKNGLHLINEWKEFDIRNPDHIIRYLRKDVLRRCSAERYMLFTWDHGTAFGVFIDNEGDGIRMEGNGLRMLNMDDMARAVTIAFDAQKVDIITMMNCYVQTFDTGFSLASAAKFLIAPETFMQLEAYDYKGIFDKLNEDPDISPKQLARFIVGSFARKNKKQKGVALFANQLKYYKILAILIDKLAAELAADMPTFYEAIKNARRKSESLNGTFSAIDFFYFLKSLEKELPPDWNKSLITKLKRLKRKTVLEKFVGDYYIRETTPAKLSPQAFSVMFPANESYLGTLMMRTYFAETSPNRTLFAKVTRWNDFVNEYVTHKKDA